MKNTFYRMMLIACVVFCSWAAPASGQGNRDEEARKYMVRGMAAIEMAKSEADLAKAAVEFKKATEVAPRMADAWNNLAAVQAKIGQTREAIASYRQYLALAPQAEDVRRVGDEIIKLEYRLEQAEGFKALSGEWLSDPDGKRFRVVAEGSTMTIEGSHSETPGSVEAWLDGTYQDWSRSLCLFARLEQRGDRLAGYWQIPARNFPWGCAIPAGKAEVEAALEENNHRMVVQIKRPKYKLVHESESILSARRRCTEVTETGAVVERKTLRGPIPAGSVSVWSSGQALSVGSPVPGSEEERAGLKKGDAVVAIDGVDVATLSNYEKVLRLRGQPGSTVRLTVKRATKDGGMFSSVKVETISVSIRRTAVPERAIHFTGTCLMDGM